MVSKPNLDKMKPKLPVVPGFNQNRNSFHICFAQPMKIRTAKSTEGTMHPTNHNKLEMTGVHLASTFSPRSGLVDLSHSTNPLCNLAPSHKQSMLDSAQGDLVSGLIR